MCNVDFEFKFLTKVLLETGFPGIVIDTCIRSVLNKLVHTATPTPTVSRKSHYAKSSFHWQTWHGGR